DGEEEVVSGPYGGTDQHGAVRVPAEDLAAGRKLCPPLAEYVDTDVAALGLDKPVHLLRLVPSPQVGQLFLRVLEGFAQGGDRAAEFEVFGLPETEQRTAGPLGHRHAQPVGSGVLRRSLGAERV